MGWGCFVGLTLARDFFFAIAEQGKSGLTHARLRRIPRLFLKVRFSAQPGLFVSSPFASTLMALSLRNPGSRNDVSEASSSIRRLVAVFCMAAGFLASVILLETHLTDDQTLDQAALAATTDLMPWIRAAVIWLASGLVLVIAVVALLVRQLPKDAGH